MRSENDGNYKQLRVGSREDLEPDGLETVDVAADFRQTFSGSGGSARYRHGRFRESMRRTSATDLMGIDMAGVASKALDASWNRSHVATDFKSDDCHIEHLVQRGYSVDEISEMLYLRMQDTHLPNFLDKVNLDPDGGLDRIEDIWTREKILWCILLFASVVYNIAFLLSTNWVVFRGFVAECTSADQALFTEAGHEIARGNISLNALLNKTEAAEQKVAASTEEGNIYAQIQDPSRRYKILAMVGVVGTAEVVWVFFIVFTALVRLLQFMFRCSEYRAYGAITGFFNHSLPLLGTFSLLRFVARVHPALIYTEYLDMLNHSALAHRSWSGTCLTTVYFVLTRGICVVFALQAFAVKLVSCALKLMDSDVQYTSCLFLVIGLMNQCIGCVHFENVMQDRIFLFIFGGADSQYAFGELAYRNVYRSRLAKTIWEQYWQCGQKLKAIVLLATLDHFDLQRLLLDENKQFEEFCDSQSALMFRGTRSALSGPEQKSD